MNTYQINLGRTSNANDMCWYYNILKVSTAPTPVREMVDIPESGCTWAKELAGNYILEQAETLDFKNNEVIFMPTMERMASTEDLRERLELVRED